MQEVMDFALWFLTQLPDFLLSPPISAFVGLILLSWVISVTDRLIHL